MLTYRRFVLSVLTLACVAAQSNLSFHSTLALCQSPEQDTSALLKSIDAASATLESASLDETQKSNLESLFQRGRQALIAAEQFASKAAQFRQMAESVASDMEEVQREIAQQEVPGEFNSSDASVQELTQRLATQRSEIQQLSTTAAELSAEPARRKLRIAEIPTQISAAELDVGRVRDQLAEPPPANESQLESQARESLLKARQIELEKQIEMLRSEQAAYSATNELLPMRVSLANTKIARLRIQIEALQALLVERQSAEAEEDTRELQSFVKQVPEELRNEAESIVALSLEKQSAIDETLGAIKQLDEIEEAYDKVRSDLATSRDRIKAVGLTDALGLMLREHRQDYTALRDEYRPSSHLRNQIQEYQVAIFRLEDEAEELEELLQGFETPSLDWQSQDIDWERLSQAEAQWVLRKRRQQLIAETLPVKSSLLETLLTSDTKQREILQAINRFNSFVNQKLFWIRSSAAFSLAELQNGPKTLLWFSDISNWRSAGNAILVAARSRPFGTLLLFGAALGLIYYRSRIRRWIAQEGKSARKFNSGFRTTLVVFIATIIAAAVWPFGLGALAYLLLSSPVSNSFVNGVGSALAVVSVFIASRELLKEACRESGLADSHFGWIPELRTYLRWHLRWYATLGGICIFLVVAIHSHPDVEVRTLGDRIASTCLFMVTSAFHYVALRPRSPLYIQIVMKNSDSMLYRYRSIICWVSVALPVCFGVMSMAGYLDTTFRLSRSLQSTFFLFVLIILAWGIFSRWLTLQKRNVMRRRAQEQRERQVAREEAGVEQISATGIEIEDELSFDLPTLDQQARQTVLVFALFTGGLGLLYIWSDVLPALEYFNEVVLWNVGTGEVIESVTVLDLAYCLLAMFALVFAARNLPSMLELLVLSRTSLDSGARYAISTLLRYVMIVGGSLFVLNLLSVPYQQLGWLVAAASLGLGFGLQEIVANFVSGIILLIERPVRVGDVVTIDGTTGTVSRIQMRATTVTSWDRKELVVPNKDLITQKLLNWSLSNVINRLTIQIGVEYDADPDEVRKILIKTVAEHPNVLDDPPPLVNLEAFGDSALVFHVRFFLAELTTRIDVTHEVNSAITRALREAGVVIPFPQRDVNFKFQKGVELPGFDLISQEGNGKSPPNDS